MPGKAGVCSAILATFPYTAGCACPLQPLLALAPLLSNLPNPDSPTGDFSTGLRSTRILPLQNPGILLLRWNLEGRGESVVVKNTGSKVLMSGLFFGFVCSFFFF